MTMRIKHRRQIPRGMQIPRYRQLTPHVPCIGLMSFSKSPSGPRQNLHTPDNPQSSNTVGGLKREVLENKNRHSQKYTKWPKHRRRTWTVRSSSQDGANVHPNLIRASLDNPSPQPKRHVDRFSRFCRTHDGDRLTDSLLERPTDHALRLQQ